MTQDEAYMARALQLARYGAGHVSPNPMVGCVIAASDGRIIGEGFHRRYGEGHAEVNAMESVRPEDECLVRDSTVYVTLEPCSHFGKTPPCAQMLCRKGVKRVVIGCGDPNPKVNGRGMQMLRESGIEVTEGCLRQECERLNERFFSAQREGRPWIELKWAETASGAMHGPGGVPITVSTPLTKTLMHRERACCDAILAGTVTLLTDNPSLTVREWPGESPRPVIFDSARLTGHDRERLKVFGRNPILLDPALPLEANMRELFSKHNITSLMVEGGRKTLETFAGADLCDCIRLEKETSR